MPLLKPAPARADGVRPAAGVHVRSGKTTPQGVAVVEGDPLDPPSLPAVVTDADDASAAADRGDDTLLDDERLLDHGPEAIVYRLLDAIVDGYAPVLSGLEIDKEQIERQVYSGDATVTERIYRLSQDVIDLRQATAGLTDMLHALRKGFDRFGIPAPLQTYLQDVADHLSRVDTQVADSGNPCRRSSPSMAPSSRNVRTKT